MMYVGSRGNCLLLLSFLYSAWEIIRLCEVKMPVFKVTSKGYIKGSAQGYRKRRGMEVFQMIASDLSGSLAFKLMMMKTIGRSILFPTARGPQKERDGGRERTKL